MSYIQENDCDLIALTYYGEIVGYTTKDEDVDSWVALGKEYDWFCVELDNY